MNRALLTIICLAVLASSCAHKDYIEPALESPVFSISGYRNGEPFTIAAGQNNLIQTASVERNKFGVVEWSSSFVSANCPTCDAELTLTVNDLEGVNLSDCGNLEIFANNELQFAQEASTSNFEECTLSIEGAEGMDETNFFIPGANSLGLNTFSMPTEGTYQVSASFELEIEGSFQENEVHIHQTIYAGEHQRVSAPFLYEVLEIEENEQEIRLTFPEITGLRATHWEINGILDEQESFIREFETGTEYQIEIFYINDATGIGGSYSLRFNQGFPFNEACDEDHHIMPAPSINIDWATGIPNYERAFITYRWQGKTYISTTPLNTSDNSALSLLGYQNYPVGLQGNDAIQLRTTFSVKLVELGNESNVLELTDCVGSFGFIHPN
jgi:hypothetical protein